MSDLAERSQIKVALLAHLSATPVTQLMSALEDIEREARSCAKSILDKEISGFVAPDLPVDVEQESERDDQGQRYSYTVVSIGAFRMDGFCDAEDPLETGIDAAELLWVASKLGVPVPALFADLVFDEYGNISGLTEISDEQNEAINVWVEGDDYKLLGQRLALIHSRCLGCGDGRYKWVDGWLQQQ